MRTRITSLPALIPVFLAAAQTATAQANFPIFTDNLVNGYQQGWSYRATVNFANTSPVNSGSDSISATIMNSPSQGPGALVLENNLPLDTSPFTSLSFWINGGATGGQQLRMYANLNHGGQFSFTLPKLPTNTWQQMTISLAALGVANKSNFTGIAFQGTTTGTQPIFYVDDVQLNAAPAPGVVHLNVDALQTVRAADARWFGLNTATWDGNLGDANTLPLLKEGGFLTLRWPGGSTSDAYHWASDTSHNTTFRNLVTNIPGAQAFITVNYGSGTSNEAAGWVLNANVTNHAGFKYWEIGNECYGSWETDTHAVKQDPYTYAVQAAGYMAMMRAADTNIHIGMVVVPGEDSSANNTNHPATNPRTGLVHNGWTPVMLATLNSLGATPDFVIYHYYPQYTQPSTPPPAADSDQILLQISANWANDAADIRQQITDYLGAATGSNIELTVTENNSDPSSAFGRQLTSIVNGLYLADAACQLMKTEFNSYLWWDLRNGHNSTGDFDPTVYGWRTYGDEGLIDNANDSRYPGFYCAKMLQYFVRPGDTVLNAPSDYLWLASYAARKADGALTLLVINKDATTSFNGQIAFSNFVPWSTATVRTYGIPQDNAVKNNDLTPGAQDIYTNSTSAGVVFTNSFPPYSLTLFTFSPAAPQLAAQPVSGSEFAFTLQGQPGTPYVIQTSGDLSPGSWSPVSTNTTQPDGTLSVTNTIGAQQFWRAMWQP